MRLSKVEIEAIHEVVYKLDPHSKIRLFGSRVNDNARGGDIDLLIISHILTYRDKLLIRSRIKERLGNRKIDIIITKKADTIFIQHALNNSVLL